MLLSNSLFRLGAAAVLLSNRSCDRRFAKYKLLHVVRTHIGADDTAYHCLYQQEDPEGIFGISITKDVMALSGHAIRKNLTSLGPLVLSYWQQFLYFCSLVTTKWSKNKPYVPKFNKAFDHICVHAGGRAVVDAVQKNLELSAKQVEPSRMTLHRFGNTSSSSIWYELGYVEAKGWMKEGQKVWQLGLGSGFKCNSAVWECMRAIEKPVEGAWSECIDRYPVEIPDIMKF